jgi:hypothetical protein
MVRDIFTFGAQTVKLDITRCQLLGNTRRQTGGVSLIPTPNCESQLMELSLLKTTKATEDVITGVATHQTLRKI